MFGSPSPLVSPTQSGYSQNGNSYARQPDYMPSQQEMEMTMRRKWQEPQEYRSDPYTDYVNEFNSCSNTVKQKISQDANYQQIDFVCESLIKQALYESVIPQIINTPQGRPQFERLLQITRDLKNKYGKEEADLQENMQKMQQDMQMLLSDDIIKKRISEIQSVNNTGAEVSNG